MVQGFGVVGFRVVGFGISGSGKRLLCFVGSESGLGGIGQPLRMLLEGSWDLVTRVIIKVTSLIITYNPN